MANPVLQGLTRPCPSLDRDSSLLELRGRLEMLWRQQVEEVTEVTIRLHDARAEADRASVDGARINLDLGMIEAQLEASRRQLLECDAALARFAKGTFGYCGHCGKNIDAARLASMPATPVCASCQFWSRRA